MAVYVDDLHDYGTKGVWCHMWADEEWELEIMRKAIGLKMAWIQLQHKRFIHYDLRPSKRELAIKKGAIYKPLGEWIRATYPKKETDDTPL